MHAKRIYCMAKFEGINVRIVPFAIAYTRKAAMICGLTIQILLAILFGRRFISHESLCFLNQQTNQPTYKIEIGTVRIVYWFKSFRCEF